MVSEIDSLDVDLLKYKEQINNDIIYNNKKLFRI